MDVAGVRNAKTAARIVRLEACVHMSVLIDVASKSGFEENSQGTRFFNDFRANVEPYFECEDVFRQRDVDATTKLLLTIDAHSDGVKK